MLGDPAAGVPCSFATCRASNNLSQYIQCMQVTLEKQARQLDVMKACAPAAGPGAAKGKGRKAERLEKSMKMGVFRELTAIRWKQALVVRSWVGCREAQCSEAGGGFRVLIPLVPLIPSKGLPSKQGRAVCKVLTLSTHRYT